MCRDLVTEAGQVAVTEIVAENEEYIGFVGGGRMAAKQAERCRENYDVFHVVSRLQGWCMGCVRVTHSGVHGAAAPRSPSS